MRHHPRATAPAGGFSLIELLVVIAIIALFFGAVVLSVGVAGRDRDIEREVFRLSRLLDLIREEAIMQSRDFGLLFTDSGYRFYVYDYTLGEWVVPIGDQLLAGRNFGERIELSLFVEDREIVPEAAIGDADTEAPQPQVLILSTGELTPFRASLARDFSGDVYHLVAEFNGDMELTQDVAQRF